MLNKNFDNILQKKVFQILLESVQRTDIESYLVGGVVRDHLLGRGKAKDIDVVAVGSGIELAKAVHQALPGARPIQVFKSYGTAMIQWEGITLEFVGARKESYTRESRNPKVISGTLEDDQNRRDFTVNALAVSLNPKNKGELINDVSGLEYDQNTIQVLKETNIPFVLHHMQGEPKTMQRNPTYNNVLLDIYDFFENKIRYIRSKGIKHNNIILDPGIGFGKNLKHNITILNQVSIFHSLGFPVMLGLSRKRFIKDLAGNNDSKERIGGTVSSSIWAMTQGIQILRIHDVNEVNQAIKIFKSLHFI